MLNIEFINNRVFNSRTYILSKEEYEKVWLVDCGDIDRVIEMIGEKSVEGVLLTHAHSDHIYGLESLMKRFPVVKIYTNAAGVETLKDPRLNLSHYHSEYPDISIEAPKNVRIVNEEDSIDIMGVPAQVYETPGHAPSCITYVVEDRAFTGDAYIPGVKVFTGFPYANRQQAQQSVERILQLCSHCKFLPGHTLIQ